MDWKDIKTIVMYADKLLNDAKEKGWTEQEYYEKVLFCYKMKDMQ